MNKEQKPISILIIEDELHFAEQIKLMIFRALDGLNRSVYFHTATSINEARAALEKNNLNLITLDGHLDHEKICTELLPDLEKITSCTILLLTRDDRIINEENTASEFYISRKIIPQNLRFRKGFGQGDFPGVKDEHYGLLRKLLLEHAL
jgi:DNA-binding response OmpR family regulator